MFLILFIVGFILRFYQLNTQVLWDDEWHSILNVRDHFFWDNATHFREADNCIPLTIFHQILKETVGLNEFGLRILPFLAGLLTIFFCYWAIKKIFDKKTSLIFTALIIISPLLIYFSRYARPYSIVALLSFTAVLTFYEWVKTEKKFYAAVYIIVAVLAPYFHLFALPTVIAPLGLALFISFFQMKQDSKNPALKVPPFKGLLKIGITIAIGIGLWLAPLLHSLTEVKGKMHRGYFIFDSFLNMLSLFCGTNYYFLIGVCVILFVYGFICLYKKELFLFLIILTIIFLQSLAIIVTMPTCIEWGIVLARYGISFLLFWLLVIAIGISDLYARFTLNDKVKKRLALAVSGVTLFTVMLFLKGPLLKTFYYPNNFTNHKIFQYDYRKEAFAPSDLTKPTMQFYYRLKSQSNVQVIVEYPCISPVCVISWDYNLYYFYQRVHGKRVIMGEDSEIFANFQNKNIRLKNWVDIENPDSWKDKAAYLIIHKNISKEIMTLKTEKGDIISDHDMNNHINNENLFFDTKYHERILNLIVKLKSIYGQPIHEDEFITAFKNSPM